MKTLTFMRLIGEIDMVAKHILRSYDSMPERQEALKDFIVELEARIDVKIDEVVEKLKEQR